MKKAFLVLILIAAISLSGCFTNTKTKTEKNAPISPKSTVQAVKEVSLYFLNSKMSGLNMEVRSVSENADLLKQVINELMKGPKDQYSKPIIPDNTKLLSVQLKDTTAYVNFSKDYTSSTSIDGTTAKYMVAALVNTLTGLPNVNSVQILVEGNKIDSLYGYKIGLDPLSRIVLTGEVYIDKDRVKKLQESTSFGKDSWRLDPMKVIQEEGGVVGFSPDDDFSLESKKGGIALINAIHDNKSYLVTLVQPEGDREGNIWVISDVKPKFTKIPEADPTKGETFIYGIVKAINYDTRVVTIEREYQDTNDINNVAGPDIKVLPNAIIHRQSKIGYDSQGGYQYSETDMDFTDIKVGDELGMILTKNKEARAVIDSDKNTITSYSSQEANIIVLSPMRNNSVTSPIKVVGKARVFEAVVNIRLLDSNGNILTQTSVQASAGAPSWGDFQADIQYNPLSTPQDGTLQVFSLSPKDGSVQDLVSIPLYLK
ncbi:sporulation protein [Thermoanaerobacterium sp. PSU-2]|uniref:Gmad2 immunoglobulin-like domain-containing protein n=1 Tax=Thermoanaerobacterium sp. PSU-2 TaxID=1930849 RepID=UPI000A15F27C|nr:Gmad2 immunoglobulin-like domain-containing protein [Thermoanaerobacterium sp. PSU-2]ORX24550.1 sporulation protein [Thermoanaerobacterium sp. PSU-2]